MSLVEIIAQSWILKGLLLLVPIILWVAFFQKRHPQKQKYVLLAFISGMISVIPIKLYERYWDLALWQLEHLNLFTYLSDLVNFPDLARLLAFLIVNILVALGIYLFIMLAMFLLEVGSGDNTVHRFRKKVQVIADSPFVFITAGALMGIIAFSSWISLHEKVWFFLMVGMLEEFTKHLCVRFADEDKICSINDALGFSIIVGLGFAYLENILYVTNFISITAPSFSQLLIFLVLRSTVSVLAHVGFSAIFGYFYGLAQFSTEIYQKEAREGRHPFLQAVHRVCHMKGSTIYAEEKLMEGMLLSMILHAAFNSLLEFNQVAVMLALLLGMAFSLLRLFHYSSLRHAAWSD